MPTYTNPNNFSISVTEVGISLNPGITSSLVYISDNILENYSNHNITKISEEPYYNPILQANEINLAKTNDTYDLSINYLSDYIHVSKPTAIFYIYLNSVSNTPPIVVGIGEEIRIFNRFTINKLIIKASLAGSLYVEQIKNYITEYHSTNRNISTLY